MKKFTAFILAGTALAPLPLSAQPIETVQPPLAETPGEAAPDQTSTQSPAPETADPFGEEEEIVIVGGRPRGSVIGDISPQNVLDSRDVRATGATSISELLEAIAPQVGSAQGRGGERPVLLLNGQRISGFRELRDIPTEAIERTEILPEEVALKYGYGATQKVVNIVLRERFRSTAVQAGATAATDGGYQSGRAEVTRLSINRAGRSSLTVKAEGNGRLTEAERDIDSAVDADPNTRTLLGSQRSLRANGSINRTIFGNVSATASAELEHIEGRALLGFGDTVGAVLDRDTSTDGASAGFALNGAKAKWNWSVIGNAEASRSRTGSDRDDPLFTRDRAREDILSADVAALANGTLFKLPAGDAGLSLRAGVNGIDLEARRIRLGETTRTDLGRGQATVAASVDLPISRRRRDFDALGDLTFNANAELQTLSDFGTLTRVGAGANWSPVERVNLLGAWSLEEGAPTIQQLGSPVLESPETRLFDFVRGESVLATVITGGNPALDADSRQVVKLGANWQPIKGTDLRLRADYVRSTIERPIQSIFGPTPALESAFPERFVRDPAGTLISADLRPLNFDRARKDTLRLGVDFSKPLKSARPSQSVRDQLRAQFGRGRPEGSGEGTPPRPDGGAGSPDGPPQGGFGGRGGGGGLFGGGNRGRLTFSLTDTITFRDEVRIGPGLPLIDYLRGDAAGSGGGTPRHRIEAQAGWANNGLGARVSANWRSGTRVDSASAGTLRFSPLATVDLRFFANLGERPELVLKYPWLRGTSLRLEVDNLFDSKQRVRDSAGMVPFNYQADLIDPLGRTVMISVRKLFLPSFAAIRREREREAQ